jgi:hypothetical protein
LGVSHLSRAGKWGTEHVEPWKGEASSHAQERAAAPAAIHQSPRQVLELVDVHAVFSFLFCSDRSRGPKTRPLQS